MAAQLETVVVAARKLKSARDQVGIIAFRRTGAVGVRQAGAHRVHVQRIAHVIIGRQVDLAVIESQVHAAVDGPGGFPGESVRNLAGDGSRAVFALAVDDIGKVAEAEAFHIGVGIHITVAEFAPGEAELGVGEDGGIDLEPGFLRDSPGGRYGREETPLLGRGELGGAVVAAVQLQEVSLVVGVIDPAEEAGRAPARLIGIGGNVVAHGELDILRILRDEPVTEHLANLTPGTFPVETGEDLDIVFPAPDFGKLGILVGGEIGLAVPGILDKVVHTRRADPGDMPGRLAVGNHGVFLGVVVPGRLVGKVGVQAQAMVEELCPETGRAAEVVPELVRVVLSGHQAADGHGGTFGERAVRIPDGDAHMALILNGAEEESAVVLVMGGGDMVLVVIDGDILPDGEPVRGTGGDFGTQRRGVIGVRIEIQDTVVFVDTARKVIVNLARRAAGGKVVGLGKGEGLVDDVVVVGVAVVHIASALVQYGFLLDALLLAAQELVHPGLGILLAGIDTGRLGTHIIVIGLVEQAGIDITVIHDVRQVGGLQEGEIAVVVEAEFPAFGLRVLGGDEHDAEGGPGTIDGGRCGILQHGNTLDIIRVQQGRIPLHAVNQDEGAAAAADGRRSADVVFCASAGFTVRQGDVEIRDGAHQHLRGIGRRASREDLRRNLVHRAGEVGPLHAAVTHHHHVVEEFGRRMQEHGDGARAFYRKSIILIPQGGDHNLLAAGSPDGEGAVQGSDRSAGRSLDQDPGADHRLSGLGVFDDTGNRERLGETGRCQENKQQECNEALHMWRCFLQN